MPQIAHSDVSFNSGETRDAQRVSQSYHDLYPLHELLHILQKCVVSAGDGLTSDIMIKRLGNVFRLKSSFLNLTTADFLEESGCHFSSPRQPQLYPLILNPAILVM